MTSKKSNYHHGDLVAQIERIATDKIRQNGADNLSLRSCARDAGVDPAALYRHFKSKDALLGHLALVAFADLAATMQSAQAAYLDTDPKEALIQVGLVYIDYAITNPHMFQMMFDVAGRHATDGMAAGTPLSPTSFEILVTGIQRLNPTTDLNVHVFTLWSLVHGFSKLVNSGLGPQGSERCPIARALCETAVNTIT